MSRAKAAGVPLTGTDVHSVLANSPGSLDVLRALFGRSEFPSPAEIEESLQKLRVSAARGIATMAPIDGQPPIIGLLGKVLQLHAGEDIFESLAANDFPECVDLALNFLADMAELPRDLRSIGQLETDIEPRQRFELGSNIS